MTGAVQPAVHRLHTSRAHTRPRANSGDAWPLRDFLVAMSEITLFERAAAQLHRAAVDALSIADRRHGHLAADDELAALRAEFPRFRIIRETVGDRARYVARRLEPGTRPHTVVTADPSELRAALARGPAQPRGRR